MVTDASKGGLMAKLEPTAKGIKKSLTPFNYERVGYFSWR